MAKKAIGKIDTNTLLLVGGGILAVILLTKKSTTTTVPTSVITVPSGGGSGIPASTYVTLGNSLINALDDIFS